MLVYLSCDKILSLGGGKMLPEKYHLETRYKYTLLNASEKRFYEFVVERLLNLEIEFYFVFFEEDIPKEEHHQALPRFYTDFKEYIDINKVISSVDVDWPEFYYIDFNNYIFLTSGYVGFNDGKELYTPQEIEKFNSQLDEIISKFDHISDDFELELAVHDFIVTQYSYDTVARERDMEEIAKWEESIRKFEEAKAAGLPTDEYMYTPPDYYSQVESYEPFSVIGFLKKNMGVCEAYTDLAQLIFQRKGIPCVHFVGPAGSSKEDEELHAWLAVKIKGHYYHLDITFNDFEDDPHIRDYSYFNLTDEEISVDHQLDRENYPDIVCDHTEYNYYKHFNACFDSYEKIKERILKIVEKHKDSGKTICYCFKCTAPLDSAEVERTVGSTIIKYVEDYDGYLFSDSCYSFKMIFKGEK